MAIELYRELMNPEFSAYKLLEKLCKVRDRHGSYKPMENMTNRAKFIVNQLDKLGVDYYVDRFPFGKMNYSDTDFEPERASLYNIEVKIEGTNKDRESLVFGAHHDIANADSDNCNDNSAGCTILLEIIAALKVKPPSRTAIVVFTDGEELGGRGAYRLSHRIKNRMLLKVTGIVNLELCAKGNTIWIDHDSHDISHPLAEIICRDGHNYHWLGQVPFNEAMVYRASGIESVCLGIFSQNDLKEYRDRGFCKTWKFCHQRDDKFEIANEENMEYLVKVLCELARR